MNIIKSTPPLQNSEFNFAKYSLFIFFIIIIFTANAAAQPVNCGLEIPDELNAVLIEEASAIEQFVSERGNSTLEDVPVRFTALTGPGGGINLSPGNVNTALGILNAAFEPAGLHFVQCGPINKIWDDRIKANNDIDHFTTSFSYTSGALEVYVGLIFGGVPPVLQLQPSYAPIPALSYQSGNPNFPADAYEHTNFAYMYINDLENAGFIHEIGHHYGLLHTFMPAKSYNVPVIDENTPDYPYPVLNSNNQMEPWWWGRELVIRNDVPQGVKTFYLKNSNTAGDLVSDTPADCSSNTPGYWPGCPITAQNITTCEFNSTLTYTDYNGDPINPPPAGLSLGRNYMSYWDKTCLNQFSQGQFDRIGYYYETVRKPEYTLDKCDNFTDKVEFEGSNEGLHNVTIRMRHPNDPRKCNVTTDDDGNFGGILHLEDLNAHIYHNGKKNTLAYANDPLRMHYDHTNCEWLQGVSTFDLVLIARHILGISPLASGYRIIAADANMNNAVTTFDIVEIRKLILGIYDKLPVPDQPWRYIPEFIPQDYSTAFNNNPFQVFDGEYLEQGWQFNLTNAFNGKKGFDGIKIGDVNGSWLNSSACPKEPDLPEDEGEKPVLIVPSTALDQNDVVALTFRVSNFQDVEASQLGINLPYNDFELLDVADISLPSYTNSDNFGLTHLEDNSVRTLWYDEDGGDKTLPDSTILFSLIVRAKQAIPDLQSKLKLDNSILKNCFWQDTSMTSIPTGLLVTVEPAPGERGEQVRSLDNIIAQNQVFRVFPNPAKDNAWALFKHTGRNATADLAIINGTGVTIHSWSVFVATGDNQIDIATFSEMPPGIYWIVLNIEGKSHVVKIVK